MSDIRTIIAGLALDGRDRPALDRAILLSAQHGARLILVHVIESGVIPDAAASGGIDPENVTAMLRREAADRLDAILAEASVGIHSDRIVVEGTPFEILLDLSHDRKADLVVIGPGMPRNLREKVLGSTADRIVRSTSVPVLVVRLERAAPYRRVVVAADLSPPSLSASKEARAVAPEASIEHIHAVEMPLAFEQALLRAGTSGAEIAAYRRTRLNVARDRLRAAFAAKDSSGRQRLRIVRGDARDIMVRQATNGRTDLVALGTHGRGAVAQALLGSVTRHVLRSAECDVLVVSR
jgi:nucleotide-binding universal stress UspA family protein